MIINYLLLHFIIITFCIESEMYFHSGFRSTGGANYATSSGTFLGARLLEGRKRVSISKPEQSGGKS